MEIETYRYDLGGHFLSGAIAVGITGIAVFPNIAELNGDPEKSSSI